MRFLYRRVPRFVPDLVGGAAALRRPNHPPTRDGEVRFPRAPAHLPIDHEVGPFAGERKTDPAIWRDLDGFIGRAFEHHAAEISSLTRCSKRAMLPRMMSKLEDQNSSVRMSTPNRAASVAASARPVE